MAVASAVTPSGGRLAGKHDLGMLCVAAGERAGFDALDVNWKIACEIATENGRTMDTNRLRLVLPMHLADTREQAIADVRYGLKPFIDYFNNNQPRFSLPRVQTSSTGISTRRSRSSELQTTRLSASKRFRKSRGISARFYFRLTTGLTGRDTALL